VCLEKESTNLLLGRVTLILADGRRGIKVDNLREKVRTASVRRFASTKGLVLKFFCLGDLVILGKRSLEIRHLPLQCLVAKSAITVR